MFRFSSALPRDVADVLESAALLEVSEYRVFELAHRAWFGAAPRAAPLERSFFDYLCRDRVPPWVRAFARAVVARGREPGFDPAEWGAPFRPPARTAAWLAIRYALWTVAAVVAICVAAHYAAEPRGCMFPPC